MEDQPKVERRSGISLALDGDHGQNGVHKLGRVDEGTGHHSGKKRNFSMLKRAYF